MGQYAAPLRDMQFVLHELLNVEAEIKQMPKHADLDADTINAVLEEAGKFCAEVLFPLNQTGDQEGCRFKGGNVTTPDPGDAVVYDPSDPRRVMTLTDWQDGRTGSGPDVLWGAGIAVIVATAGVYAIARSRRRRFAARHR